MLIHMYIVNFLKFSHSTLFSFQNILEYFLIIVIRILLTIYFISQPTDHYESLSMARGWYV